MELPDTILKKLPEININRAFFVTADHPVKEIYEAMAFYVIAREAIRCEMPCVESLADALPDHSWFRCLTPRQLLEQLQVLRTTCVNNKSDRCSYRMRYCMAGILFLAANDLASHSTEVITGAVIQKAGIFAVLTGGPKMRKLIHDKIAAPRLFWILKPHFRTYNNLLLSLSLGSICLNFAWLSPPIFTLSVFSTRLWNVRMCLLGSPNS